MKEKQTFYLYSGLYLFKYYRTCVRFTRRKKWSNSAKKIAEHSKTLDNIPKHFKMLINISVKVCECNFV